VHSSRRVHATPRSHEPRVPQRGAAATSVVRALERANAVWPRVCVPACVSQRKRMAQHPWPAAPFTLSIADAYFFEEICKALCYKQATHWLAHRANSNQRSGAALSSADVAAGSAMCSPLPAKRNPRRTGQVEMSGRALELGPVRGLPYTDAAHRVLDVSPTSSRKAVDSEAGGAKQKLASGFRDQDVSGHHHHGRESWPREEVDAAARVGDGVRSEALPPPPQGASGTTLVHN
jgi:hypothetical protein